MSQGRLSLHARHGVVLSSGQLCSRVVVGVPCGSIVKCRGLSGKNYGKLPRDKSGSACVK